MEGWRSQRGTMAFEDQQCATVVSGRGGQHLKNGYAEGKCGVEENWVENQGRWSSL
jgi:hypothetical protein